MPGLVTILANPECPHCVHAVDTVALWCIEIGLPVAGLDMPHHPEMVAKHHVEHSPSILFERDGGRTTLFAGLPSHAEFLRMAAPR